MDRIGEWSQLRNFYISSEWLDARQQYLEGQPTVTTVAEPSGKTHRVYTLGRKS